jgi:hypothetical protein
MVDHASTSQADPDFLMLQACNFSVCTPIPTNGAFLLCLGAATDAVRDQRMGAEPTNLHRYQESEYAAGREMSAFRLEFVGFLAGVVIKPPSCGTYISVLIHYPRPQYSMYLRRTSSNGTNMFLLFIRG